MPDEPLSLYVRLGGEPVLTAAVERLSRRVLHDPLLAPAFNGVEMGRLRAQQHAFLSRLLGAAAPAAGPGRIAPALAWAEAPLDALADQVIETLSSLGIDPELIAEVAVGLKPAMRPAPRGAHSSAGRRPVPVEA